MKLLIAVTVLALLAAAPCVDAATTSTARKGSTSKGKKHSGEYTGEKIYDTRKTQIFVTSQGSM